ncbi:winged helix-turn-helix domain-containing protein [Desulfosporosinus hippei]|uniref:Two-component system, OmpR family, KDP operon response regulator KdpE n=1 Tax=Desulfosporosinus hippei DSM 8344 TaxID=1121419 RepID=A0A1G8LRC3_9FIRM|nr:helix-turn-helix domain-containing protein [Desulfosporosinus hippei]SDI58271.1 two-component system, OmpR family, KDP operon response regulator KdpE [Desulfosporosinus hippei DSM 8344]
MKQDKEIINLGFQCFLDIREQILYKDDQPINLSKVEFKILYFLGLHLSKPVSEEDLIKFVWKTKSVSLNYLYVCINRIRNKIEDDTKKPSCLLSLRGVGYILYDRKNNKCLTSGRDRA